MYIICYMIYTFIYYVTYIILQNYKKYENYKQYIEYECDKLFLQKDKEYICQIIGRFNNYNQD